MRRALLLLVSITALGMPAVAVHAQATPIAVRSASDPYADLIAEAAQRFAIPAAWIRAIMRIESRGDRRVVSIKGARGPAACPPSWPSTIPRVVSATGCIPSAPAPPRWDRRSTSAR